MNVMNPTKISPALRFAALALALILIGNGLAMLAAPETWYRTIPGVTHTGPFNVHFVRDIGCAYLVSGLAFVWLSRDTAARPAAMMGTLFLLLHAGVHIAESIGDPHGLAHLARDFVGVFVLAFWALGLVLASRRS
jgi:uncharacterized protein YjeT (DUF2065 family)